MKKIEPEHDFGEIQRKMYGVTVEELLKWNKKTANAVSIGEKLIVSQ